MAAMGAAHDEDEDLAELLAALEPLPLGVLDAMLGGMLFPTGAVADLQKWRGNTALAESLRNMYMRKAFGRGEVYERGMLRAAEHDFLPARQELIDLFALNRPAPENWQRAGAKDHLKRKQELVAQALASNPPGSVQGWSLEDKLEAIGCAIWGRGPFNLVAEETGRYEFYTREYIEHLAAYLHGRLAALGADPATPGQLVEVGAGSGSLSFFVNGALEKLGSKHRCVATDPDLRPAPRQRVGPSGESGNYEVEALDVTQTLAKYKPALVLCAWMPMDTDWSQELRACSSVKEYVLVGEADFGACGHNWLTWGNPEFHEDDKAGETVPPYAAQGWTRVDLPDLAKWQMQRYDSDYYAGNSVTVSFRRG